MIKIIVVFDDNGNQTKFEVSKEEEGETTITENVFAMITLYKIREANEISLEVAGAENQKEFEETLRKYDIGVKYSGD